MKRLGDLIDAFRPADGPPPRQLWPFFRWSLSGSWPTLALASGISALAGVLEVMTAIILGLAIDAALSTGPAEVFSENAFFFLLALAFFVIARPIVFGLSSAMNSVVVGPNIMPLVLSRLHRWTLGQAVTFFDNDFAGRISQKQMQTARSVTDVIVETVNVVFFALATLIGAILLLTTIDWRIALALAVWLVAYGWLIRHYLPRILKMSKSRANARAMVTGQIVDTITNIKTVKLFAHADHEETAALDAVETFRERAVDLGILSAAFRFYMMTLAGFLPLLLVGGSIWLWSNGTASAGDIAAAGSIAIRIAQMTGWVTHTLMGIYGSIGEVEDGINTLTRPWTMTDAENAIELPKHAEGISFTNVTFTYGRDTGGVRSVDLRIAPGEKVGMVGASGAGKSTIVSLLLRLYDAESGQVEIGGHDVSRVTQESLRRRVGMVTQETAMFNRSAFDNIRYGNPDASIEDVVSAAKRAEAHEFIEGLRDHMGRTGYDAHLGERGVKLSGGQRQRIALARAIIKDAPILVLDEATSALDSEVEAQIQNALNQVMEGKTVLAIAHRLSTIARMDRIVVLAEGRIVEEGRHADLLAKGGIYAKFWNRQSGGFINVSAAAE